MPEPTTSTGKDKKPQGGSGQGGSGQGTQGQGGSTSTDDLDCTEEAVVLK